MQKSDIKCVHHASVKALSERDYVDVSRDVKRADIGPKFTNIYPKRGISVNLPRLCEVGLLGKKAGLGFNIFKELVTQQLREQRAESQNKSYIASETYVGDGAFVTGIDHSFVILNLFQDNMRPWFVILKQVQDDELWGERSVR